MATRAPGMALGHLFSKGQELESETSPGGAKLIHPALVAAALSALVFASYSSAVLRSLRPSCKANNKQANSNPSEEDGIFHSLGFLKWTSLSREEGMLALLSP